MNRVEWEDEVATYVSDILGCDDGDAQGILEIRGPEINMAWEDGLPPYEAAQRILGK